MHRLLLLFLAAALGLTAAPAPADILVMQNGQRRDGVVEDDPVNAGNVVFHATGGRLTVPRTSIREIEWSESRAAAWAGLGDQFMAIAKVDEAIEAYDRAMKLEGASPDIQRRLDAANAEKRQREAGSREQERRTALNLLDEALALADARRFEDAVDKVRAAEQRAGFLVEAEARSTLGMIHYKWGLSEIDRLNPRSAAEKVESALSYQPEREEWRDTLITIYERLPDKATLVLENYRAKLEATPSDDELREKVARLEYRGGNVKGAADELLRLADGGRPMSAPARELLEQALFHLVSEAVNARDFDRCVELYTALLRHYPNNDRGWLYYFEYYRTANKMDQQNPIEHFDLARFCEDRELWDLAKMHYSRAIYLDPEHQAARDGLQRIAEYDLVQLRTLMAQGDWVQAKFLATQIIATYPRATEVIGEAQTIMDRADSRLLEEARQNQKRATEIARRGDEYYAQAQGYLQQMQRTDFDNRVRVYSPGLEAQRHLERAIAAWRDALRIDPSLAAIDKGDLRTKLADAQRQLDTLTSGAIPLSPYLRESPQRQTGR